METFYLNILLVICLQTLCLAVPLRDANLFYRSTAANGTTIICLSCPPGTYLVRNCTFPQTTGQCQICPIGYFQPNYTNSPKCLACVTKCLHVDVRNRSEPSQAVCEPTENFCSCKNSTYILDSECPPGKEPAIQVTSFQHTICKECPEETYSDVYSSTEMCKPSTKCGLHEVAILDGDKTRDRECMLRSGDFNDTWDMTTITAIMNTTNDFTPQSESHRNSKTTVALLATLIPLAFIIFSIGAYIYVRFSKGKCKRLQETQHYNTVPIQERHVSSSSDILEIDEHASKCSYSKQRNDTQTVSRSKSDECIEPLNDAVQVLTNIHNNEGPSPQAETLIKQTDDNKALDAQYKMSKVLPKPLDDPCPKTFDVSREKANKLPKTLHVLSETTMTLPKYLDISYEQAKVLPCLHSPKRKTILSTDWQRCEQVTNQGCILQLPNSDVITTFPPGFLSDGGSSHCYKTVHNDIPRIAAALHLQDDTVITSPVPEYYMQEAFAEFVQILIPHRMPKNYEQIKVHSFSKHTVSETVDLVEVKCVADKNKVDDDIDMFYVVNFESVVIHTKRFSGFVCTTCQRYIEYNLSASIYGRQGKMDGRTDTLDVLLYLKGAKASITDFRVATENKIDKRFHHLETQPVKLLEEQEQSEGGQLQFRFCLISESIRNWIHRKANDGVQLQDDLVLADPEKVMRECETHIICRPNTKWFLQRDDETHKNCDFYVEIVHKEKPASAMDTLRYVKTYIPASEDFEVSGALAAASEQNNTWIAFIPQNRNLATQEDKNKLFYSMLE
ncbi:Tumor necrosis factor receptor superfamily member 11B [Mizuhopecten yessoensis]|uniref:Tumor necrosis factor receptor superfamily member 11B n=1 Tax=Mizuhopecten yessoensis TaxID=6573 RepID=A0A210PS87_MIZYE|nr:Tumor necrosis factor receptor superfamily member 11B [Mizuhopecten yessoensis]